MSVFGEGEEIEIVGIFEELPGEIGLGLGKGGLKVGGRFALAAV